MAASDPPLPPVPEALRRAGVREVRDNLPPDAELQVSFLPFFQDELAKAFLTPVPVKKG